MSRMEQLDAITLKAGSIIRPEDVRFVGWSDNSLICNNNARLYYSYGLNPAYDYILADPLICQLSVEQILSDSIVFKINENHILTVEEVGQGVLNNI